MSHKQSQINLISPNGRVSRHFRVLRIFLRGLSGHSLKGLAEDDFYLPHQAR
jgi:hypothetical protein